MRIKVMTYNIQSGRNLQNHRDIGHAIETILQEAPDIISLNEVHNGTKYCPDGKCQAEAVAKALGYSCYRFGRSFDHMGGQYGNALISRFPILDAAVFPVPDIPEEERDDWFEPRTHLRCVIDLGDRKIVTLNTHYGLSDGEIKNAVTETVRLAGNEELPLLFMGDLNATPDSPLLAPLFPILTDTASALEGGVLTIPSDHPTEKIDYLFHRGGFKTIKSWIPVSQNSDHRPVCAELEI